MVVGKNDIQKKVTGLLLQTAYVSSFHLNLHLTTSKVTDALHFLSLRKEICHENNVYYACQQVHLLQLTS